MNYESYLDLMKGSFTIVVLIICSIVSLKVVIEKYINFKGLDDKFLRDYSSKVNNLIKQGNISEALAETNNNDLKWLYFNIKNPLKSLFRFLIERMDYERDELLNTTYTRLDNVLALYEKGLGVLATLGAVSPFIGLFGTVVGIIRAFSALALNEASSYNAVMFGIAEALISTAAGILVAIPAVMFYNYFIKRIKLITPVLEEIVIDTVHNLKVQAAVER